MIEAMNNAEPAVFAIMDYWTFDGWLALRRRLKDEDAPALKARPSRDRTSACRANEGTTECTRTVLERGR